MASERCESSSDFKNSTISDLHVHGAHISWKWCGVSPRSRSDKVGEIARLCFDTDSYEQDGKEFLPALWIQTDLGDGM